jgi:hypothetical protein
MRTKRTRVATAVVALLLGGLLALFATSGPAVAFFSGGLFLDVQVESPARLLARGAAVEVPLEVTCNAVGTVDVQVTVTQRSGSGATQGFGFDQVGCTGAGEQVTVVVQAFGAKAFKKALLSHPWVGQARPGSGGHSPPRASMARPMSAAGDLNPNAIRVSRRSLVLTDSTRALEAPCRRLATIVSR